MTPKLSLKEAVLCCVGNKLNGIEQVMEDSRGEYFMPITLLNLFEAAASAKYRGIWEDLFLMADNISLSNENGEFEKRVITPVKKAQGIYY